MKKPLLAVWMEGDDLNKPKIHWEFGDKANAYFLLGVLDIIKQELIDEINEADEKEK
ncbi:hypothetical protein LCGC14_1445230 [marine sediment metagenome]|uniref:Uncharacterized protein n=1 Tax=marine sediment metagenome TaxID=412755 RepID=A0A0F9LZZ6_9ZZZZ